MNPNPTYSEFLIRLIGTFKDKTNSELARIAISSATELCGTRSFNAVRKTIGDIKNTRVRVDKKDIDTARKLLKDLPKKEISNYDLAEMRLQTKPVRNK